MTEQLHFHFFSFFIVQLSHPYMTTGKTIALTRLTFVSKVMSLLFNMLSRLVITFLPRSTRLLISWLQSPSAVILAPQKIKSHCFHCFPIYLQWSDGSRCHDLSFLNIEFKASVFTQPHEVYSPWNLQASILEWVAFPFSRGSSQPRDRTQVSRIAGGFFTSWATREAQEYWSG